MNQFESSGDFAYNLFLLKSFDDQQIYHVNNLIVEWQTPFVDMFFLRRNDEEIVNGLHRTYYYYYILYTLILNFFFKTGLN